MRRLALVLLLLPLSAASARAQGYVYGGSIGAYQELILNGSTVVTARDQGWYNLGTHYPDNNNYIAGYTANSYRNFFVFDIPTAFGPIYSAALRLNTFDVAGEPQTVSFFDFLGSVDALTAGTGGIAAYEDLGSGVFYGARTYTAADEHQVLDVALNDAAIGAIGASQGGTFALGGAVGAVPPASVAPEPVSMALLGTGLAGLAAARRRRRRDADSE